MVPVGRGAYGRRMNGTHVASRAVGLALLVAVSVRPTPGAAQITFGPKAGLSLSTLEIPGSIDASVKRTGVVAGAFVDIPLVPGLGLQAEVYYTQKGANTEYYSFVGNPPAPVSRTDLWRYEYVEVAALVRARTRGERTRVGLSLGPYLARQISGDRSGPGSCFPTNEVPRVDVGLTGAAALDLNRTIVELRVEGLGRRLPDNPCGGRHVYGALTVGFRLF